MSDNLEADQQLKLMLDSQARDRKKMRMALVVAALIAALLWNTQWPAIKPGLIVLLAGQVALAGFLFVRGRRFPPHTDPAAWSAGEDTALRQATWLEHGSRALGFLLLAFGFWRSTGSLIVSIALGVVYPAAAYFTKPHNRRSTD